MSASKAKANLRARLCEAQNHRCAYCGRPFGRKSARPTLEHYQAKAYGGKATYENCVAACQRCNSARGTAHPMRFWWAMQILTGRIKLPGEIEGANTNASS